MMDSFLVMPNKINWSDLKSCTTLMAIKIYQVSFEHSLSFAEAASTMAAYGSKEWHTKKHKKKQIHMRPLWLSTTLAIFWTIYTILPSSNTVISSFVSASCGFDFSVLFFGCLMEWERHAMADAFIHGTKNHLTCKTHGENTPTTPTPMCYLDLVFHHPNNSTRIFYRLY